jgi:methionyl-tRNA formyltransferase
MRIVLHGQQAFGSAVLDRLIENKENIVAVCAAPDKENGRIDPLVENATKNNIPVYQPSSWKTQEAYDLMKSFDADLCVMAYVTFDCSKSNVLDLPKLGLYSVPPFTYCQCIGAHPP